MENPHPEAGHLRSTVKSAGRWATAALVTWGLALSLLVGADGSPGWQVLRVAIVLAVTAAAAWLWARTRLPGGGAAVACGAVTFLEAQPEVDDEAHAANHIRRKAPESVSVWIVTGAGHTGGLSAAPAEWESTVIGFLDASLARP